MTQQGSMTRNGARDAADGKGPLVGLDALLIAAARDCPDAILFRDDGGAAAAGLVAGHVQALAALFRQCGLSPGERILLVMGSETRTLVALIAALRAGLEPALVPCGLGPLEIAAHARAVDAVALIGPTHYGALALGDAYLSAAALSDTIRLVATLGPQTVDGAADFSPSAMDGTPSAARLAEAGVEAATVLTFEGPATTPSPVAHRQAALFAAALALVDQARINPSQPILSTLVPASMAGLVAGPFAALIGASGLALHGPFAAAAFLAACDALPGAHLVAPAAIAPVLREARLGEGGGTLILVSRFASAGAFVLPQPLDGEREIVDLYAFGEAAVLSKHRTGGTAPMPVEVHDGSLPGRLGVALNRARSGSRTAAGGE